MLVLALTLTLGVFGQETTGSLDINTKDANGAAVPNVAVTITSSGITTGFTRTVTTDGEGFARVVQVPPGVYSVTAAATGGFQEKKLDNITVNLGKITPVVVELGTTVQAGVTVTGGDVLPIDTTDSKIQTTFNAQTFELLPKGTNFGNILKVSPATRPEPKSGQYQIDGSSGSENTFIIDGQEVTNVRTGILDANNNLPFSLVQEVQVKSSGFEAEYGGATGGVINVVTKGGGDQFHGEIGAAIRPSSLAAVARPALFQNSLGDPEYYPSRRDSYREIYPSFNVSGPILKNRVWFFASYSPQIFNRTRNLVYTTLTPPRTPTGLIEHYKFKQVNEYALGRIDAQPFSRLRLTGTWTWNPIWQRGGIPGWSSEINTPPSGNGLSGSAYENQLGGRQNAQSVTGQATWTPLNSLVLAFRGGHYFLNEKLGTYGLGDITIPRFTCSASSPSPFPAGFGCVRGFNNGLPVDSNTLFDATTRNTFEASATWLTSIGGRHEFKGGYMYNGIANELFSQTRDQIVLRYGQTIASYSGRNIPSAPTAVGAGLLRRFYEIGDVSSKNEGIYFQDKWQPTRRLTLNLGVRTEREDVPSYTPGAPGITFDFQDKIAPRLGVAYDLTGDGKTKISAFYGWFFDRFKYELPRGSFGGNFFHDLYYEIFPADNMATFTVANIIGSGTPIPGGACPGGTTTPVFGRVRCDIDFRVPSNTGLGIEFGTIDPDIKAYRQSELTFTFERDLGRNFVFASRFTHKQIDHTIEDAGFPLPSGSEAYIIGNPGEGLYRELAEANGLLALKPERRYDALEFRLDRRFANDYYFNASYTWSRLFGNYSGLASSDEDGRLSPNVNRFFDQPQAGWTLAGGPDNGLLPTDRTHVFKFAGAYSLDWNKRFGWWSGNTTEFQVFTTLQSGTPLTSTANVSNIDIVVNSRGDLGRTEMFTETDFAIRHRIKFGRDGRYSLVFEGDALNVFNEANELDRINATTFNGFAVEDPAAGLITTAERNACIAANNDAPCFLLAYGRLQRNGAPILLGQANDPNYSDHYSLFGYKSSFQGPRTIRLGVRFLF